MSTFPLDLIEQLLPLVGELTKGLHTSVQLIRFTGGTSSQKTMSTPVPVDVIEDLTQRIITKEGRVFGVSGTLLIMSEIEPLGLVAGVRQEPIDPKDLVVLSNGQKRGIAHIDSGITNPETSQGLSITVYLA